LDEKSRILKSSEYSHENTVEELKSKIHVLNSLLENQKQLDRDKEKNKKDKKEKIDDGKNDYI
jgi:hypothetical protein